jgi:hypothetical protein
MKFKEYNINSDKDIIFYKFKNFKLLRREDNF